MAYIVSSGELESGIILENDTMTVLDGGIATDTTINSQGSMYISSGGTANSTTVNAGGRLNVSSGGTANEIIENGGYVDVAEGADVTFAPNTFSGLVLSNASATVHSGTTANRTTINSRGSLYVSSGGTANEIIENGGYVYVEAGANAIFASNMISGLVLSNNAATVHSGTTANSTTVNYYGGLDVFSGGTAINTTVNKGGALKIYSGGKANSTTVNTEVRASILGGGTAFEVTVSGYKSYLAVAGGMANIITINQGGVGVGTEKGDEKKGGVVNSTTLNDYSEMIIYSGGTANSTTVNQGCQLKISSGGTANNNIIRGNSWSIVCGVANGTMIDTYGSMRVSKGGSTNDTTVKQGILIVCSGGSADNTSICSEGSLFISRGGIATNTVVASGAHIDFILASDTFIQGSYDGSAFEITSATDTIGPWGRIHVLSGDLIDNLTINPSGGLCVSSGGTMTNLTASKGAFLDIVVASDTYVAGSYDGSTFEIKNASISGYKVNSGGRLFISSEGEATDIVENGGYVTIESGATVSFAENSFSGLSLSNTSATVHSGTTANSTTVNSGGSLTIFSGGVANEIKENGGWVEVEDGAVVTFASNMISDKVFSNDVTIHSGATANNTTINSRGRTHVFSGGIVNDTTVNCGGSLFISSGGSAMHIVENGGCVEVYDDAEVTFVSNTISGLMSGGWKTTVHSGTTAVSAIVKGGRLTVFSAGIANNTTINNEGNLYVSSCGTANNTTVNNGWMVIYSEGVANNTIVNSRNCFMDISSGGTAIDTTVSSGGSMRVFKGGEAIGRMTFESGASVTMHEGAFLNFDLTQTGAGEVALVNDLSIIQGTPVYTLTVDADSWKPGSYSYKLAEGAKNFASTISVVNKAGDELGVLTVGEKVKIGDNDYTLNLNEGALSVTIEAPDLLPVNLVGTADRLSWEDPTGAGMYAVDLSTDGFEHVFRWQTNTTAQDLYELPGGTYQWRVKSAEGGDWAVGEDFVSENEPGTAKVVRSNADGVDDIFFANANGTWSREYFAQHAGSLDEEGWTGTGEFVSANGKGRIQNLFFGSSDPSILCLSDGENGDAIFLDDVYTELPEELEANTARLLRIREIWAGAGDDIIDMTSQRFEYIGDGLTIRGGDGNDVIWANKGANWLFGDAGDDRITGASGDDVIAGCIGDDRMHGGGGDDVFTFCENWGKDTVKQLAGGSVTLWFASGSIDNWDADSLIYTDGDNKVTVSGVSAEQITLKFSDDGSEQFTTLSRMGAFEAFTTERIFMEYPASIAEA